MANKVLVQKIGLSSLIGRKETDYTLLLNGLNKQLDLIEKVLLNFVEAYNTMLKEKFPDIADQYYIIPIDSSKGENFDSGVWQTTSLIHKDYIEQLSNRLHALEGKMRNWKQVILFNGLLQIPFLPSEDTDGGNRGYLRYGYNTMTVKDLKCEFESKSFTLPDWAGDGTGGKPSQSDMTITGA